MNIELTEQELNAVGLLVGTRMIQLQRENRMDTEAYKVYEGLVDKVAVALDMESPVG